MIGDGITNPPAGLLLTKLLGCADRHQCLPGAAGGAGGSRCLCIPPGDPPPPPPISPPPSDLSINQRLATSMLPSLGPHWSCFCKDSLTDVKQGHVNLDVKLCSLVCKLHSWSLQGPTEACSLHAVASLQPDHPTDGNAQLFTQSLQASGEFGNACCSKQGRAEGSCVVILARIIVNHSHDCAGARSSSDGAS